MNRRDFFKIGGILAAGAGHIYGNPQNPIDNTKLNELRESVNFIYDGSYLSPLEYSHLLMRLADEGKIKADMYSNGGVVEELEHKFAELLGKESAVFMPTGTLANHIAIRKLAGNNKRVIVQSESHIYNDSGDCAQTLSNLNLIPLGKDQVCFSLQDVIDTIKKTKSGRVTTGIGAISLESPVRRKFDRIVTFDNIKKITDYARTEGIGLHMDGARLFVQSVHTNILPLQYGELFDTVYTSLYKCFNAAGGAILAGSKKFTEGLFHTRRMFGGGLVFAWPYAAVALQFVGNFIDEYKLAYSNAEKLFSLLEKNEYFKIERFDNGTHIFKLIVNNCDLNGFKEALNKRNILLRRPDNTGFLIKINPSINRESPENLAEFFIESHIEA
jgi:threonine aldolase